MAWAVVSAFVIGALCAVRLPILIFTLLVSVMTVAFALTGIVLGYAMPTVLMWSFLLLVALEAGCAGMNGLFFLLYARKRVAKREASPLEATSKYSPD
ncbi:hypothetical protein J2X76_002679 [Neorhizobium sp. 2083]|nr:hypothetical protein [Neorhizobium sp. 2083]